jgi:O-antigen ligase
VQSAIAIAQGYTQTPVGQLNQYFGEMEPVARGLPERSVGTFQNANTLANWILLLFPVLFDYVYKNYELDSVRNYLYIAILILSGGSLILTGSRGALFILSSLILSYLLYNQRALSYKLGAIALLVSPALISTIIKSREGMSALQSSVWRRFIQIIHSTTIIREHMIFGTGWGEYMSALRLVTDESWRIGTVHNMFLQKFAETGFIGFVLFTGFFVISFKSIIFSNDSICLDGYSLSFLGLFMSLFIYTSINTHTFLPMSMCVLSWCIADRMKTSWNNRSCEARC